MIKAASLFLIFYKFRCSIWFWKFSTGLFILIGASNGYMYNIYFGKISPTGGFKERKILNSKTAFFSLVDKTNH